MKVSYHPKFKKEFSEAPDEVQRKFDKQIEFLKFDIRHPSLHAKKYHESEDVWQARIDRNYRFYFEIENDTIIILSIIKHP